MHENHSGNRPDHAGPDTEAVIDDVIDGYERLLREHNSQLLDSSDIWRQARRQAADILRGVVGADDHVTDLGLARALQGIHPSESFRAAGQLFEAALPVLARDGSPIRSDADVREVALNLNKALMEALICGAQTYYDFLLDRLHRAQAEERRRVARDLHDRAAHALGVALQSLELHDLYAQTDHDKSVAKLRTAKDAVNEAFEVVRRIASEMRSGLAADGLENALASYLRAVASPGIEVEVHVDPEVSGLTGGVAEQFYLVLREAIRNVMLHARATRLEVKLEIAGSQLRGLVVDDGIGFVADQVADGRGVGVTSMRERVEALNGSLGIRGGDRGGTVVEVAVPLPAGKWPKQREPEPGPTTPRRR
ncbi:MAG: sensor histidine kinase [Catenulispora sp.]